MATTALNGRRRQGLGPLSPDLIDKASDETNEQVVRLMLAFVGTALFCLLALASPDIGLLTGNEKLDVPGAGRVSFFGFMLLGPAILIVLRIYLQIYVEHGARLGRVAQRMPVVSAPTLAPLKNPLIRVFSGLTLYVLQPFSPLGIGASQRYGRGHRKSRNAAPSQGLLANKRVA